MIEEAVTALVPDEATVGGIDVYHVLHPSRQATDGVGSASRWEQERGGDLCSVQRSEIFFDVTSTRRLEQSIRKVPISKILRNGGI